MKKLDFGEGGFQGFLSRHAEKGVLGCVVVIALYLLYSGYSIETVDKDPEALDALANSARSHIAVDSWENIQDAEERKVVAQYEAREKLGSLPTKPHEYSFANSLSPTLTKPITKRGDPELYAPIEIRVASMVAPLAYGNDREIADPLGALEWKGAPVKKKTKKDKKKDNYKSTSGFNIGGDDDDGGGFDFGDGDEDGSAASKRKSWPRRGQYVPPGEAGGGGGGMMGSTAGGGAIGGGNDEEIPQALPRRGYMVAVTALVPYEKQFNEFKAKFENAIAYEPRRDRPNYLSVVVERADYVEGAELKWEQVGNAVSAVQRMKTWASPMAPEVANEEYTLLGATTMPIPPILWRDYTEFAGHPRIPLRGIKKKTEEDAKDGEETEDPDVDNPSDIPTEQFPVSGGSSGLGGGADYGPVGGGDNDSDDSDSAGGSGMMGSGMMGSGMMGSGMMGSGGIMGGGTADSVITEYKLVRFFDFTAKPMKKYVYRVQLLLEDPNNPRDTELDINLRMLDGESSKRVAAKRKDEKVKDGRRLNNFFLRTEFSEASGVVWLNNDERFYAGPVEKPGFATNGANAEVHTKNPPKGKLATVKTSLSVTEQRLAVDVPADIPVSPGDVLALQDDLDFVHPITLSVKTLDDHLVRGESVVVDIYGGYQVGGTTREPLFSLGEYAVIGADGSLVVRDELDDAVDYRFFAFVEDEESGGSGFSGFGGPSGEGSGGFDFGGDNDDF